MAQGGGVACPCLPNVPLRVGKVAAEPRGPGHAPPSWPALHVGADGALHNMLLSVSLHVWFGWWSEQERARTSCEGPGSVGCPGLTACGRSPRWCPQGKGCGLLLQSLPSQAEGPGLLTPAVEFHCGAPHRQVTVRKACV